VNLLEESIAPFHLKIPTRKKKKSFKEGEEPFEYISISYESLSRHITAMLQNIDDPDKICMTTYFQGSTGGYVTFLMLVSNLMQPQFEYPLLDGINFLYNNLELKIWTI